MPRSLFLWLRERRKVTLIFYTHSKLFSHFARVCVCVCVDSRDQSRGVLSGVRHWKFVHETVYSKVDFSPPQTIQGRLCVCNMNCGFSQLLDNWVGGTAIRVCVFCFFVFRPVVLRKTEAHDIFVTGAVPVWKLKGAVHTKISFGDVQSSAPSSDDIRVAERHRPRRERLVSSIFLSAEQRRVSLPHPRVDTEGKHSHQKKKRTVFER